MYTFKFLLKSYSKSFDSINIRHYKIKINSNLKDWKIKDQDSTVSVYLNEIKWSDKLLQPLFIGTTKGAEHNSYLLKPSNRSCRYHPIPFRY